MILFAAATGLRPGEWIALEQRDIDLRAAVVYVRRAFRVNRLKPTKTESSLRAVPLQRSALDALDRLPAARRDIAPVPRPRRRLPRPAQLAVAAMAPCAARRRHHSDPGGSTICGTRSPPSRCAPGSAPSSSALHGHQPDQDRPNLRPPRPRQPPPRRPAARLTRRRRSRDRRVDVRWTPRRGAIRQW